MQRTAAVQDAIATKKTFGGAQAFGVRQSSGAFNASNGAVLVFLIRFAAASCYWRFL